MAVDLNLETISSGFNTSKINRNFIAIDQALQNAVSRSGESPNQMNADFDMNSNDILNAKDIRADRVYVNGVPIADGNSVDPDTLLPIGGTDGQVLTKQSSTDYDVEWEDVPEGIPPGGTDGQVLTKQSGADFDANWETPSTGSITGSTGATDNALLRADGTGGSTIQSSGVVIDDDEYVTGISRITIDTTPAFDLAAGALASAIILPLGASPITVSNKTFSAIRLSETSGADLTFSVTHTDGVASGVYSSVTADSGSVLGSDLYGAVLHATNAGAGTTRGAHIGGYGVSGSTGILNALAAELQPVSTQGFTSGLFVSLNSSGVHDKAFGVAVESGNGDRYLVAYGNGVNPLPINVAYFRAWMATGSSTNARAFSVLDNGGSEIAYWHKDGTITSPTVTGTTSLIASSSTNGITITQATISRNNAAGSMTLAAGTNASNTFAIQTGGSTRFSVADNRIEATGFIHANVSTAVPANGSVTVGVRISSTTNLGIYVGAGPPTGLSAGKGSLYTNTTATTTTTRLYVNTDGGTTWANFTASA